ncbi:hypothetical protein [Micromonospora sp. SH-82]|uniref:hypothetical protein n=1 Tax=Micromonospora sp. SH-82 TaxID=3132938 RepID=UPI003EBB07D6
MSLLIPGSRLGIALSRLVGSLSWRSHAAVTAVRCSIIDQPKEVAALDRRRARISGDALTRAQSLALITEAADSWT